MKSITYLLICLLILLANHHSVASNIGNHNKRFTDPNDMKESDWSDPQELERSWNAALVRIPKDKGKYYSATIKDLSKIQNITGKFPTIIYLHGCSGIWKGTYTRINFFARSGFAVIAPVSFARLKYPQSCDLQTHKGGMHRHTLKMRQNDTGYAIEKAKLLNWVDENNVFLAGLSQGGITTATFSSKPNASSLKARIIEGWTCHAGWPEYKGINAPNQEPVLSLVGEKDPWFQNQWTRGDCGEFMKNDKSVSKVFKQGHLSTRHELLEYEEVQNIVLKFLTDNLH